MLNMILTWLIYLFFSSVEVCVVHEPEDEFKDGQGLVVVALLRLGQERGLDRLPLHLPQVRLEINVRPLKIKITLFRHFKDFL